MDDEIVPTTMGLTGLNLAQQAGLTGLNRPRRHDVINVPFWGTLTITLYIVGKVKGYGGVSKIYVGGGQTTDSTRL